MAGKYEFFEKEDSNDKMGWQYTEGYPLEWEDSESLSTPLNIESFQGIDKEQQQKIAKGVAIIVLQGYWGINWGYWKDTLSVDLGTFCSFREAVFKSMTKFVLNIFDMDDFQRVLERVPMIKNYRDFYGHLYADFSCVKPAFSAMRDVSEGIMDMKKFPFLKDEDVGCILEGFYSSEGNMKPDEARGLYVDPPIELFFRVGEHHIRAVLETVQNYLSLSEERKSSLMTEMEQGWSCAIVDDLWDEARMGIPWNLLSKEDTVNVEYISYAIETSFYFLAWIKAVLLKSLKRFVIFPLVCGGFGARPSDDVLEVVWIANIKRLQDGQRFLRVHHMRLGFYKSTIAESVEKITNEVRQAIPDMSFDDDLETSLVYCIYKLSVAIARHFGSEIIELEHLFLATLFRRLDDYQWNVIVRKEAIVEFVEQRGNKNKNSGRLEKEFTPLYKKRRILL